MPSVPASPPVETAARYDAFVSYSHAKDKPIGAALQSAMQKLGKPWYRRRALRIFRDDTSLAATPELWPTLEQTLTQSRYLIVLASPQFARSKWCGMEVAHWLAHKGLDTLLIAVTEGDLQWDSAANDFVWDDATPLPPVLKGHFRNEPKWIDLRPYRDVPNARDAKFMDAAADLAAVLHGLPKEDLLSQEVLQQKRALRLAWSAAASLTLLAAGAGWQWWEAETAKQAAERNLAVSQRAADEIVMKIADGLKDVEGMPVGSVRRVLDTVGGVIDELARSAPNDLRLQSSRAGMLEQFARTFMSAGDYARARASAAESLTLREGLVAIYPDRAHLRDNVADTLVTLGDIEKFAGNEGVALVVYEKALLIYRDLLARNPANADIASDENAVLGRVGMGRLAQGDHAGALQAFEQTLGISRKRSAAAPESGDATRNIIVALGNVASVHVAMGRHAAAIEAYDEALDLARRLALANPYHNALRHDIALLLRQSGDARAEHDTVRAVTAYQEALTIARKLTASDARNGIWRRDLNSLLLRLGDLRIDAEDAAGALTFYAEGVAGLREAVALDPRGREPREGLRIMLERSTAAHVRAGHLRAAIVTQEEGSDIARALFNLDDSNVGYGRALSDSVYRLAMLHADARDKAASRIAFNESVVVLRQLANQHPNASLQHDASRRMVSVAEKIEVEDRQEAIDLYAESAMLLREIASDDPANKTYRVDLAKSLDKVGTLASGEQASLAISEAMQLLKALADSGDLTPDLQQRLAAIRTKAEASAATSAPSASASP